MRYYFDTQTPITDCEHCPCSMLIPNVDELGAFESLNDDDFVCELTENPNEIACSVSSVPANCPLHQQLKN